MKEWALSQPEEAQRKRRKMNAHPATVTASKWFSPDLVRLSFISPDLVGSELPFSDHYIKFLFVPEAADYSWPFNLMEIRESLPRELHPVTRTYTLRTVNVSDGTFDVDFVAHGDNGLAGPWAQHANVGDQIGFVGPGGAWKPSEDFEHFVFAGDEAAAPAIFASIEALPEGATATAFVEIDSMAATFDAPQSPMISVNWVPRDGATHGTQLIAALRSGGYPEKRTSWFIHGVAEMVKETRRFLFVEGDINKADVSISGYWRLGMTEDQWQASKRDFNAEVEAEEAAAH